MSEVTKPCSMCKQELPLSSFYNSKVSQDGKGYRCKPCDKSCADSYKKTQYLRHRELRRKIQRKSKYNLTEEDFDNLLESQNGLCAICDIELDQSWTRNHKSNRLVVDHNHKTGKVRGLLCTMCNKGIGLLKDDSSVVQKAANYLKKTD